MQKGINIFLLTNPKRVINQYPRLSIPNFTIKLHKKQRITPAIKKDLRSKILLH